LWLLLLHELGAHPHIAWRERLWALACIARDFHAARGTVLLRLVIIRLCLRLWRGCLLFAIRGIIISRHVAADGVCLAHIPIAAGEAGGEECGEQKLAIFHGYILLIKAGCPLFIKFIFLFLDSFFAIGEHLFIARQAGDIDISATAAY
jgi:hypothetical protein